MPQVVWELLGACAHPKAGLQVSIVQIVPSSQVPPVCKQPVAEQVSVVQAFPSSQPVPVPLWQVPSVQTSPIVQGLPSLQGLLLLMIPQIPLAWSQVSVVQGLLSVQGEAPMQRPCEQTSPVVQAL
jgi:hypothetical protein